MAACRYLFAEDALPPILHLASPALLRLTMSKPFYFQEQNNLHHLPCPDMSGLQSRSRSCSSPIVLPLAPFDQTLSESADAAVGLPPLGGGRLSSSLRRVFTTALDGSFSFTFLSNSGHLPLYRPVLLRHCAPPLFGILAIPGSLFHFGFSSFRHHGRFPRLNSIENFAPSLLRG